MVDCLEARELDVVNAGQEKKRLKRSVSVRALVFAAFIAAGIYLYHYTDYARYVTKDTVSGTIDSIRLFVSDLGLLGSTVFAIAGCLAITINIPSFFVIVFAVIIFGGLAGAVVSAISIYMATTLIYFAAQLLGKEFVHWAFGARLRKIEDHLNEKGLMTVVYVRLLFFMLPPVNWLLSLTNIRYRDLLLGTLLGTAHMIILSAWVSDMVIDLTKAGQSLNPFKTPELLLPGTIGVVIFAMLRLIDRSRTRRS